MFFFQKQKNKNQFFVIAEPYDFVGFFCCFWTSRDQARSAAAPGLRAVQLGADVQRGEVPGPGPGGPNAASGFSGGGIFQRPGERWRFRVEVTYLHPQTTLKNGLLPPELWGYPIFRGSFLGLDGCLDVAQA